MGAVFLPRLRTREVLMPRDEARGIPGEDKAVDMLYRVREASPERVFYLARRPASGDGSGDPSSR